MRFLNLVVAAIPFPGIVYAQSLPGPVFDSLSVVGVYNSDSNLTVPGVADSLAAFNAAQSTVVGLGGGRVVLMPGTWNLSGSPTLAAGVNWASPPGSIFPTGQLNADIFLPQYGAFETQGTTHPASGTHYAYQYVVHDNVAGGETGVQEGVRINISSYGSNVVMGAASHNVGLQVEATVGLTGTSTQQLQIPIEAVNSNPNAGTTVANMRGYYSKLVGNQGTITNYFAFYDDAINTGPISNFYHYFVQPVTGTQPTTEYAFYNNSSNAVMKTIGKFVNSTSQEFAPAPATIPIRSSRYFFGVQSHPASGTVTPGTGMLFAPWFQPGRGSIAQFGIVIATPQAAATCSIGIFAPFQGLPGSVSFGPYSVSAAASGAVFTSPALTLDAGLYHFGVTCSNPGVVLSAYTEDATTALWGVGTPGGNDNTITSTSSTFATSPPITYTSGSSLPLIWVSQ